MVSPGGYANNMMIAQKPNPGNRPVLVKEYQGDKLIRFERDKDGMVSSPDISPDEAGWMARTKTKVLNSLVPENLSQSVSKDYVATRKWQLARDFLGAFAGTASLAAVMTAVAPANMALAALSIAGLTVANVNWFKDRMGQVSSIAATNIARIAEKNPRPWMMASDVIQNVGTVVDAATCILPPIVYFPLLTGMGVIRAVGGAAGGAAGANVGPRQAIKGNLGEVSVKNGNQSTLATFAGSTAGIAALGAIGSVTSFGTAVLAVAGIGAVGSLVAYYKMLQALDYNPVNEKSMRYVMDHMQSHNGEIPPPSRNLVGQVLGLVKRDTLVAGDKIKPLLQDKNFEQLRDTFKDRPYIMSIREGKPYLVLKHEEGSKDQPEAGDKPLPESSDFITKIAQTQAMYQGIMAERLLASPDYASKKAQDEDAANKWVIDESLKQTPADIRPFMVDMQKAGWSVDTVRFWGEERPATLENAKTGP